MWDLLLTVMTELHEATSLGDLERVEEALKRGLNPNEPDSEWADRTPLHIAASNGYFTYIPENARMCVWFCMK